MNKFTLVLSLCFMLLFSSAYAQKTVSGLVTDSEGEPLPGVTVMIKGSTKGTLTDAEGTYSLSAPEGATLQFSFIGMANTEIVVGNQKSFNVILQESAEALDEVVVTAFGATQKKESVVGSIQSIRPDELIVPSSSLSNAFAGRLAGVISYQRSGQPGADGSSFYIRGISTISG
ncbi:MAG: carboxypeptidase-like regulatory domain-containing protein, partial [Bacteroidales bacterium]